jgi:RuvB-like protein 2
VRDALLLYMTAARVAAKRKSAEVDVPDIRRVYSLFVDVKRSTQFLMEYQSEFMFNEVPGGSEDPANHGGEAVPMAE